MTTILSIHRLSKSFEGIRAVNNISFDLNEGELLAMIGPNGAGKSTCFNLINGQLVPDSGSIVIFGKKINGLKPRHIWRLGVGRTFQITSTFISMTVLENVQMALLSHHGRTLNVVRKVQNLFMDESIELLERVGMADQQDRACGTLAYGDLKRVELAVALANNPKLLLMDEPTAGMGPKERSRLMELTAEIVQTHRIGVLFTEHDMEVVFKHADRIIVLNQGKLVAQGCPEDVRRDIGVQEIYLGREEAARLEKII